jgi:hypothetical protein
MHQRVPCFELCADPAERKESAYAARAAAAATETNAAAPSTRMLASTGEVRLAMSSYVEIGGIR